MPVRPPTFRPRGERTKQQRTRDYDQERGSAAARGYDAEWRRARAAFLADHPLCVKCEREDVVTAATIVDHRIPHRGDEALFWDRSNWQALCKPHHDGEKQREERAARR